LHSLAPERFIVPEPIVNRPQGFGVQTAKACSAVSAGNDFDKTPEKSPPREWLVTLVNATVLPTMPITMVMVVVMLVMPIRVIIICVTRIVAAIIRPVVRWNTKSKSHMNSSLGLIRQPGHQTERHER